MTRPPTSSCSSDEKDGLKKGPWTPDEDQKLVAYIQEYGHGSWRCLPLNAGLQRCGKSCRLRWTNYLRPDIKRGRFSQDEDQMIVHLHAILGNRWSAIASHIPRRTDNEIKNYWNTHLKKRLVQMGIDPVTHKSTNAEELVLDGLLPGLRPVVSSNLTHMSQWENARAEAEARLSRQSSQTSSASELVQSAQLQFTLITPKAPVDTQSSSFMSSWKAQVAETLRPNFGVVEVEKSQANHVNLHKFLQEWDSSLQPHSHGFSGYDSPIDVPDLSSGTCSEVVSPCQTPQPCFNYILPSSAQITERLLASRCEIDFPPPRSNNQSINNNNNNIFSLPRMDSASQTSSFTFPGEAQFSPTSTLRGREHDSSCYTNSPCVSSNTGDSFDLLSQSYSLITPENESQSTRGGLIYSQPQADAGGAPSFWSRQQAAMADALQPEPAFYIPELQAVPPQSKPTFTVAAAAPMLNHVGVPNNIPIPQFDFLC